MRTPVSDLSELQGLYAAYNKRQLAKTTASPSTIALSSRHDLKSESKAIKHINNSAEARIARFAQ